MMNYVFESIGSLAANRLRTILAVLGLAVGVCAVISIQILGHATSAAMAGVFQGLSNYTFLIQPNFQNGFDAKSGIRLDQVQTLQNLPHIVAAIPSSQQSLQARVGHQSARLSLSPVGGQAEFYPEPFAEGRAINPDEVAAGSQVCVLSSDAAKKVTADGGDVLGDVLTIGSIRCTIVGILQHPPQGAISFDFEPDVSIPYTLFERTFMRGSSKVYGMQLLVDDPANIADAEDEAKNALRDLKNGKYTYQTFDNQFLANVFDKIFTILTVIVGAIGSISLVVAGIGIMNILLVSIVERTREIGVRKAVGGKRGQIMLQFFIEAAVLTFGGCTLGVVSGVSLGSWINQAYIVKISGVIVPVAWEASVILAVIFASFVTLVFGLYPALRAASLDPIEALRYE